jgi:LacI family transcriptional regulator
MTEKRLAEIIRSRGIDTVLIAPLPGTQQLFQDFDWDQFCAVQIGYSLRRPALHRACTHQFQSMFLLAQKLHEAGYRRIGLAISQAHDERVNHHWSSAFLGSQRLWQKTEIVPPLLAIEWSKPIFDQWLSESAPDAVITIGDEVGKWLKESGKRVPHDIGLANVDLEPYMVGVTGIHRNKELLGFTAVDLLVSLVRHNERGIPAVPRINMVEGTFVQATTTRSISSSDD